MHDRVDVHTLICDDTEKSKYDTRIVPGIKGNILQARINAFASCPDDKEFVSFIDPGDNLIITNIYDVIVKFLDENEHIGGVYTNSYVVHNANCNYTLLPDHKWSNEYHLSRTVPIHQCVVVRKTCMDYAITQVLNEWPQDKPSYIPEQLLYAHIKEWHFMNLPAYQWNRKDNGASTKLQGSLLNDECLYIRQVRQR